MINKTVKTKSAGGVVFNDKGKVLVVNQNGNSWSLPKGHIDEGENELAAAKREIYEESGIKNLELIKKLGSYDRYKISKTGGDAKSELKNITIFLFKTDESNTVPIDPENPEIKWLDIEEVANYLTHRKDQEFYLKVKDNIK